MERYSRRSRLRLHAIIASIMLVMAVLLWFAVENRNQAALQFSSSELVLQ